MGEVIEVSGPSSSSTAFPTPIILHRLNPTEQHRTPVGGSTSRASGEHHSPSRALLCRGHTTDVRADDDGWTRRRLKKEEKEEEGEREDRVESALTSEIVRR
jgi:hypothetical protein